MSALAHSAAVTPAPLVELIALAVGPDAYVIDIMRVREVLRPLPIVAVRQGPAHIEGVINLRRSVVPVIDLGRRLGVATEAGPRRRIVVVVAQGRPFGLVVDAVTEVVRVPASALQPAPPGSFVEQAPFFMGICADGRRTWVMLDLRRVVGLAEGGTP